MCGRKYIKGPDVEYEASERFGIKLNIQTNLDLRPTNTLSTVILSNNGYVQLVRISPHSITFSGNLIT